MSGVREICLRAEDAVELSELLAFLVGWIDDDPCRADAALAPFVGVPMPGGASGLRDDLARFAFLLGQADPGLVLGRKTQDER